MWDGRSPSVEKQAVMPIENRDEMGLTPEEAVAIVERIAGYREEFARVFPDDRKAFGKAADFPHTATTYRLTEHFHFWTKHARLNAIIQPQQFVEIGEDLAKQVGVVAGDRVKVSSNRGYIIAVAVVTKRIKPLMIDGKKVYQIGLPIHQGFRGIEEDADRNARTPANLLTPAVTDPNAHTPESKGFLVKVEKA